MLRFSKDSLSLKVGLNTMYQIMGRFVTAVTGLLVTRMVISSLGISNFGDFQIAITYITIFWLLTDFGLNAVVVREMSAHPDDEPALFSALLTMRGILSTILAIGSALFLFVMPYTSELKLAILIGIGSIFTQGFRGATHGLFQTRLRYDLQFWSNLIGSIAYLAVMYAILQKSPSTVELVSVFLIGQIVSMIVSIWFADMLVKVNFNVDMKLIKHLTFITIPFGLSLLFNLGNFKLDAFLLSVLEINNVTNADAVAIYNVAYKFFEFGLILPMFFMNVMYPLLVKAHSESLILFKTRFWQTFITLFVVGIFASFVAYILSPFAVSLVAESAEFTDSVAVLRLLMVFLPVFFMTSLLMWSLLVFNKQKLLIYVYGAAFITNLVLNYMFIPTHGYYAATITTGISEMVILIMLSVFMWKTWRSSYV